MQSTAVVECPVCRGHDLTVALRKHGADIITCRSCDLQFCANEPTAEIARSLYSEEYFNGAEKGYVDYIGDEATHRQQARRYLKRIRDLGQRPGRLLDVGCAAGFFLDEARLQGWDVTGCEVSDFASRHAREVLGLPVVTGDYPNVDVGGKTFDLITFFNVLEHLPDARTVAERTWRMLSPGGKVAIETWDHSSLLARMAKSRWHQYSPAYVPYYFTRSALRQLWNTARWVELQYGPSAKWISWTRALSLTLPRRLGQMVTRLSAAMDRVGLHMATSLPYFAGDLVFAVFERRAEAPAITHPR